MIVFREDDVEVVSGPTHSDSSRTMLSLMHIPTRIIASRDNVSVMQKKAWTRKLMAELRVRVEASTDWTFEPSTPLLREMRQLRDRLDKQIRLYMDESRNLSKADVRKIGFDCELLAKLIEQQVPND